MYVRVYVYNYVCLCVWYHWGLLHYSGSDDNVMNVVLLLVRTFSYSRPAVCLCVCVCVYVCVCESA